MNIRQALCFFLALTIIVSLLSASAVADGGIFVFSPDDVADSVSTISDEECEADTAEDDSPDDTELLMETTEPDAAAENSLAVNAIATVSDDDSDAVCSCGSAYDNGICSSCGSYQPAALNDDGYYEIGNAGQLLWFAAAVNSSGETSANAILTADIDLNPGYVFSADGIATSGSGTVITWTPIGKYSSSVTYTGCFDGQNHTISGLYYSDSSTSYVGLFGYINGATIQNITVTNSYIYGGARVGGIIGSAYNCTITNCHNSGAVSSSSYYTSGIVAYADGTTITGCTNSGSITSSSSNAYISGIASGLFNSSSICDCSNSGNLTGCYYVGGIAARAYKASVTNCHNSGTITVTRISKYGIGGIIGCADTISNDISHCINTGTIYSNTTSAMYVGGIIGYATSLSGNIVQCLNYGDIQCSSTTSGNSYAGGLIGYLYSYSSFTICACANYGDITISQDAGGLLGYVSSSSNVVTITDCMNVGTPTVTLSSGYAGAIIGSITSSVAPIITNCYYLDTISVTSGYQRSVSSEATVKSADAFASGEVTYLLNSGITDGTQLWYQTLSDSAYPSFSGETVYYDEETGSYSNTNDSQPEATVYSVEISWGSLSFTYQDADEGTWDALNHAYTQGEATGWLCDNNANKISVSNNSTDSIYVSVIYQSTAAASGITGSFDSASATLSNNESKSFFLSLSGIPTAEVLTALNNTCIGTVTITITAG